MYQYKALAVPDFMSRPAPPNYIAGLGRGATGFTTRSDIGPARETPDDASAIEAAIAKATAAAQAAKARGEDDDDGEQYQDPDNETGLFATAPYEADDEEADRIYEEVDRKMDDRRRIRREAREREELEKYRKERPKIQQQFADLKRGLSIVSNEEWASIPEVGDMVRKRTKKNSASNRSEKFTPVPDSVLLSAQKDAGYATSLDVHISGMATPALGTATPAGTESTDFQQFGKARGTVLGLKLDQISDSVSGQSTVDPKGYLTDLNSIVVKSDAEISDIKKARTLLKSVTVTNPKHAPGWIAAARLEEVAGKIVTAREVIAKGCQECPKSEDVWLESARLNTPENAKVILASSVRHVPQSVKIWLRAMQLETDAKAQKRVLRRALEFIPNSVKLWKAAVNLEEDPEDARILLSRAVECVPLSVELWLALARLESYQKAQKVLNDARKANPTSHEIWIAAANLEEQQGNNERVTMIINNGVNVLRQKGSGLDRDQWIKEAEQNEKSGCIITCQAIIRATIGLDLGDDEPKKKIWMRDAESCIAHEAIHTARAIYAYSLELFPFKKSVWRRAAFLEKSHGTRESLDQILERAVQHCPQAEMLWLMRAKEKWLAGDISAAQSILAAAFAANPNNEQIWLAAVKLEVETKSFDRARALLERARNEASTIRVWMKSAVLERQLSNPQRALELLDDAIDRFAKESQAPEYAKLWMIKGQIQSGELGDAKAAQETYLKATKTCPKSVSLWILSSRLEEQSGTLMRARAILERARLMSPKQPELWTEAVRLELRGNNQPMAKALMAKGLQECPSSGLLWAEAILMESRPQRKARSADALKKCENDPLVVVTVARLFWAERKVDKARNWFGRSVKINADLGDSWAWWLKFELMHGDETTQRNVIAQCVAAEPRHGERWAAVAKDMANAGKSTEEILKLVTGQLNNTI
ncbi:PRP1 splicing factor, N-terminal-domain-containing protein [Polychytrium aggregatum]|uniref:PRP1 splicing factor, N-terminal-domain-containing protein n=1 Tax=Polychytrium aggregatum TaxID=110093 RepID=UPI0022FE6535|nr:PRP1 splicing factor, N-terminal-domain-containing protein [Polychytrium aggregatum]KAI9203430.1 PRP1 splicing factor, N-terminal-domain-containing protein [Polychytrium aggregatum]